jgi:hypothetical protein
MLFHITTVTQKGKIYLHELARCRQLLDLVAEGLLPRSRQAGVVASHILLDGRQAGTSPLLQKVIYSAI